MSLLDIKLIKGMPKNEVNELISGYDILLDDEVYSGVQHKHKWVCSCGEIINDRTWDNIKRRNAVKCYTCTGHKSTPFSEELYSGNKYGKLTTIKEADDSTTKHRKMLCECECGTITSIYLHALLNGVSKTCGCSKYDHEDLTGRKYNRWTVVEFGEVRGDGQYYWDCICECGNKGIIRGYDLKNGISKSCGCYFRDMDKRNNLNTYDLSNDYGVGYTNSGESFYFSKEDYNIIKEYTWHNKEGYMESMSFGRVKTKMHNLIMNPENGYVVDHINRSKNDNRRENLRVIKQSDNVKNVGLRKSNTSGVTGVCLRNDCNKWSAYIRCDNKIYRLGTFINKDDAIKARLSAEKKYFKEFAPQKHLYEKYGITD